MNRNNNDVERKEILCNFLCLYSQMTKAMSSTIKIEDLSGDNISNIISDFSHFLTGVISLPPNSLQDQDLAVISIQSGAVCQVYRGEKVHWTNLMELLPTC